MKKIFWWSLAGILLALQLFRPNLSNPPVNPAEDLQQTANPPAAVMTALRTSCYDCHSNETLAMVADSERRMAKKSAKGRVTEWDLRSACGMPLRTL